MSSGARPRSRTRAKAPRAAPRQDARQVVVFTLAEDDYAFPIEHVREIIRYTRPRSVASNAEWVRGVINLRGRIVAIYDLAARLGADIEAGSGAKIVILESAAGVGGVVVDDVKEVRTIQPHELDAVPGANPALIEAVAKLGERLVVLLKADALFGGSGPE